MRANGRTDMTKLTDAFRNFGNVPKNFHQTYKNYEDNYISGTTARCGVFQRRLTCRYFPQEQEGMRKRNFHSSHITMTPGTYADVQLFGPLI
jgi:hypothetical protein